VNKGKAKPVSKVPVDAQKQLIERLETDGFSIESKKKDGSVIMVKPKAEEVRYRVFSKGSLLNLTCPKSLARLIRGKK